MSVGVSVCVLAMVMVCLVGFSAGEEGRLMVSKDFKEDYHVMGRNLTVEFTFHNIGDGYPILSYPILSYPILPAITRPPPPPAVTPAVAKVD